MIGNIIEWSVRNVFLVLLGTFFVVAWGVYAVLKTPIDAIPDLSDVQVIIYTEYPGQAPQVVEERDAGVAEDARRQTRSDQRERRRPVRARGDPRDLRRRDARRLPRERAIREVLVGADAGRR